MTVRREDALDFSGGTPPPGTGFESDRHLRLCAMEQYVHTLIPDLLDFAPESQQVANFLGQLVELGAVPLDGKLRVGQLSGQFRHGRHPLTGEVLSIPKRDYISSENISDILPLLKGLNDHDVVVSGQGPKLPPFGLRTFEEIPEKVGHHNFIESDYKGTYAFDVQCCLRADVVSTSDPHPEISPAPEIPCFGEPCASKTRRTGIFHHPSTGALIEVPNAGCARFWIALEFGRWIFPNIEGSLNVLAPSILRGAEECFEIKFVQGCHLW